MALEKLKIIADVGMRKFGLGLRGFFAHTYHTNDGPLETLQARMDTVTANIDYDTARSNAISEAMRAGLEAGDYSVYREALRQAKEGITHPGGEVWADIVAPDRPSQYREQ